MKTWNPEGPAAPVHGVPLGCRAVPLIEVVTRNGGRVEVRDRRGRHKTTEVVLVADPAHPAVEVDEATRNFAAGAGRRRWTTVASRYGDAAFDTAIRLVRARVVQLACRVDDRGQVSSPQWWQPTDQAAEVAARERTQREGRTHNRHAAVRALIDQLREPFPGVAEALGSARSTTAATVIAAAASDLLAGIEHAGPRAFSQAHFGKTKAHDIRGTMTAAGIPEEILERLGLRRGDRIGLGGPMVVTTQQGTIDLAPLRGPVVMRLDQPGLTVSTQSSLVVVLENLQPAEITCARHPGLPIVYTAGQIGSDTAEVLRALAEGRRMVVVVDSDLGGVRIARRVLESVADAEIIDVGAWPHPDREAFAHDSVSAIGLRSLTADPLVGPFATAVLDRGYPVEQELATLEIVNSLIGTRQHGP